MVPYTGIMASISQQTKPISPRQAARRRSPVDSLLDVELFRALADPTRLELLRCLLKCRRACSVSEVAECCDVDFSVVARHLGTLARAGVLESRKEGRTVWYSARYDTLAERFQGLADTLAGLSPDGSCCDGVCCDGGR